MVSANWVRGPHQARLVALLVVQCFLAWAGISSTYVAFPDVVLQGMCRDLGLAEYDCNNKNERFSEAQVKQTQFLSSYNILTNSLSPFLCAFMSHLGDAFGRKPLLILSAVSSITEFSLMAWQGPTSFTVAAMLAMNSVANRFMVTGFIFAALADVTVKSSISDRATLFSMLEGSLWVGQVVGPLLGGWVANVVGPQRMFWLPAAVGCLRLAITVILLPETLPHERRVALSLRKSNPFGGALVTLRSRRCATLLVGLLFASWGINSGCSTWPLFIKSMFNWSDGMLGSLESTYFAANSIGLMIVLPCLTQLALTMSAKNIILLATASAMSMWSIFAIASSGWQMFVTACLGAANAMMYPMIRSCIAAEMGAQLHGVALGTVALLEIVCQAGSGVAAMKTWEWIQVRGLSYGLAYWITAAEVAVAFLVFAFIPSTGPREETSTLDAADREVSLSNHA